MCHQISCSRRRYSNLPVCVLFTRKFDMELEMSAWHSFGHYRMLPRFPVATSMPILEWEQRCGCTLKVVARHQLMSQCLQRTDGWHNSYTLLKTVPALTLFLLRSCIGTMFRAKAF